MQAWVIWVVLGVFLVLAIGLARLMWRRQRAESGWTEWGRTASRLSWRDRRAVTLATITGQAVRDPRLAELAVQRAERSGRFLDAVAVRQKWMLRGVAVLELVVAVGFALDGSWVQAGLYLAMAIAFAFLPAIIGRDRRRLQRSADANRALLGR